MRDKRTRTVITAALIGTLALAYGVLPSGASVGVFGASGMAQTFDIAEKFPDRQATQLPRFRTPGEMAMIELAYGSFETPSVVVASEQDEVYTPDIPYSTAELEQFRSDYLQYVRDFDLLARTLQTTGWAREGLVAAGIDPDGMAVPDEGVYEQLEQADHQALAVAKSVMDSDPAWAERPARLAQMIASYDPDAVSAASGHVVSALGVTAQWTPWAPPFDYDGLIFTGRYAALSAATAMELLPPDITVVVLGTGTAVPNPFRIAAVITWGIAEASVITMEIGQDGRDDYNIEYLIDHAHQTGERVRDNLDFPVSSVDSRLAVHDTTVGNRFSTVDGSLAGLESHLLSQDVLLDSLGVHLDAQDVAYTARFDFVDSEMAAIRTRLDAQDTYLAETRALMMRMAIEENLLSDAPPLSSFQLPAADGGRLEDVRTVVVETIGAMRGAGLSVNNADTEFRRADAAAAVGDYKEAYSRYRAAYREAVR